MKVYEARVRHELTVEIFKSLSSWGSMHASVKLAGFDRVLGSESGVPWLISWPR
jgi:hypothetical protein